MSIYELPFWSLIPVPAITHILVPAITYILVPAITHIPIVEVSDPQRDRPSHPSSRSNIRRGETHFLATWILTPPSMAVPRPPWARVSKGLFTRSVLRVVKQPRILGTHRLLGFVLPYGASPILPDIRGPLALPIPNRNSLRHTHRRSYITLGTHGRYKLNQFGTPRRT